MESVLWHNIVITMSRTRMCVSIWYIYSLYNVSSSVRAMLHGVSGKFLAVRNHRTD